MSTNPLLSMPSGTMVVDSVLPEVRLPTVPVDAERRATAAVRLATVAIVLIVLATLPPLPAIIGGMTLLVAVIWGTELRRRADTPRWAGLTAGTATGLGGVIAVAAVDAPLAGVAGLLALALSFLAVPSALAIAAPRRLTVRAGWLGLGALTWLATMPFVWAGSTLGTAWGGELGAALGVALAAGIFEEVSRAVLFWRMKATDKQALVAGLGHGGLEAGVFGLQAVGVALVLGPQLWLPAASLVMLAISRIVLLGVHVGLSARVARAVRERSASGMLTAIALHVALDLAALVVPVLWAAGGTAVGTVAVVVGGVVGATWIRHALMR